MDILFVDNHLLAARKPAGIATQPTFEEMAKQWVEKTYKKPGRAFLEPIHRVGQTGLRDRPFCENEQSALPPPRDDARAQDR